MEGRHARATPIFKVGRIFLFRISHETSCVVAAAFSLSPAPARPAAVAATAAAKSTQQEYTEVSQSVSLSGGP